MANLHHVLRLIPTRIYCSKEAILQDAKTLGFLRSALAGIPDMTKKQSPVVAQPPKQSDNVAPTAAAQEEEEKNTGKNASEAETRP